MAKLDFFFGSKRAAHPLDDVRSVTDWHAGIVRDFGVGSHEQIATLLTQFNAEIEHPSLEMLEAILELDRLGRARHGQLCLMYLGSKLSPVLEAQQRGQILIYGRQFVSALQRFMGFDPDGEDAPRMRLLLPQVIGKMLHYLSEYALWQYFRHASLEGVMWSNVNQLFRYAEEHAIDAVPLVLYPDEPVTTIHDLYITFLMMSLMTSGNLTSKQTYAANRLVFMLSNRMTLSRDFMGESSFMINIFHSLPPSRAHSVPIHKGMRVWSTAELIDQLNGWLAICDAGSIPSELKELFSQGADAGLLRFLVREWAVRPFRFERAERVAVDSQQLEVGRHFTQVHRLIREHEESMAQGLRTTESVINNTEEAAEIRIYGFVSTRRREKSPLPDSAIKNTPVQEVLVWDMENRSETGFGVSLAVSGGDWLSLGTLLATRESGQSAWGLSIVRRIRRLEKERLYLGLQLLTSRPIAASIRNESGRHADPTLPTGMIWNQGEIAIFLSSIQDGVKCNTLMIPLFSYAPGKRMQMFAKNKGFLIALGKVMEKGLDWCQVEIELIKSL